MNKRVWRNFAVGMATTALVACGGGGGGSAGSSSSGGTSGNPTVPVSTAISVFAGQLGGDGTANATGTSARFEYPYGIAVDNAGNAYVADTLNKVIRKITPGGAVTTLAGSFGLPGSADGNGTAARFNLPYGIAVDGSGNVYVADTSNHTIRKITPAGDVTTLAGTAGVSGVADGTGAAARFYDPVGVAVDGSGNVYVSDSANHAIRKITAAGVVTTFAGTASFVGGSTDGTGAAASFGFLGGLALDGAGNLYVADKGNRVIRKITPAAVVTTLAGAVNMGGSKDGAGTSATFLYPWGMAVDGNGNVYVGDTDNDTIRKITSGGVVSTFAGTAESVGSADGAGAAARFNAPAAVATDHNGNVYVVDTGNHAIRKITPAGVVSTFAGKAAMGGAVDGAGTQASFKVPKGIAVDSTGNFYVADSANNTIRKITPAGVVSTLAGTTGTVSASKDGTGAAAAFFTPQGMATDLSGNVYVAETGSNLIRKISPGGVVTTLAGNSAGGSANGTGVAASFSAPGGLVTDAAGNVYVADTGNNSIRKITPAGVVTTLAGGGVGSGDGVGVAAGFNGPTGLAIDGSGNLYVADAYNRTIRKVTPAGQVTTLAGTAGAPGYADGIGAAARFNRPLFLTLDASGNLYVADNLGCTIRKITPAGEVTTVAGTPGSAGVIPGALPGSLNRVFGITLGVDGALYVVSEYAVIKITLP